MSNWTNDENPQPHHRSGLVEPHTPVAVHDAACNLIVANQPYDALMGETTSWHGIERNGVWHGGDAPMSGSGPRRLSSEHELCNARP
jgi:hypothetical protein